MDDGEDYAEGDTPLDAADADDLTDVARLFDTADDPTGALRALYGDDLVEL